MHVTGGSSPPGTATGPSESGPDHSPRGHQRVFSPTASWVSSATDDDDPSEQSRRGSYEGGSAGGVAEYNGGAASPRGSSSSSAASSGTWSSSGFTSGRGPGTKAEGGGGGEGGGEDAADCAQSGAAVSGQPITVVIERSKDPAVVVAHVQQFLHEYLDHVGGKPQEYACVFDVDNTLLYTLEDTMAAHPAGYALYHFCRDRGFRIVLVTARLGDTNSLDYLQAQLRGLGYTGYHSISMVNQQHQFDATPALCKLRSRLDIGRPVILNVGNRLVDLFLTPRCEDPVLSNTNPQTYYVFKGQHPDILCLKLPTN
jgi:hypothetical protein